MAALGGRDHGAVVVAIVWGLLLAPQAVITVPSSLVLGLQGLLFVVTAAGLFLIGLRVPALIGLALWAIDIGRTDAAELRGVDDQQASRIISRLLNERGMLRLVGQARGRGVRYQR